jgi:hypothetical protein
MGVEESGVEFQFCRDGADAKQHVQLVAMYQNRKMRAGIDAMWDLLNEDITMDLCPLQLGDQVALCVDEYGDKTPTTMASVFKLQYPKGMLGHQTPSDLNQQWVEFDLAQENSDGVKVVTLRRTAVVWMDQKTPCSARCLVVLDDMVQVQADKV